jgi:hypothetical protein
MHNQPATNSLPFATTDLAVDQLSSSNTSAAPKADARAGNRLAANMTRQQKTDAGANAIAAVVTTSKTDTAESSKRQHRACNQADAARSNIMATAASSTTKLDAAESILATAAANARAPNRS